MIYVSSLVPCAALPLWQFPNKLLYAILTGDLMKLVSKVVVAVVFVGVVFCEVGRTQERVAPQPATSLITREASPQPKSDIQLAQTAPADILIGTGDLLEVSVYGAPDFEHHLVRVSGTGDIVLPLINVQHVSGLSISQAEKLIAQKLSSGQFFNDPQVLIFVKEYAAQSVSVLGEVQKPGVYPLLGSRRLFDALSMAGGLTPKAGKIASVTHPTDPTHTIQIPLSGGGDVGERNIQIFPGDTILVSKAGIVYVVGDVRLPGGFIMENGAMTVLQALAMAQGPNSTAALGSAKLIRTADSKRQEIPIPLKPILASKAPDLKLQPDDILFVPNSAGKSAARRGLEAILQTATGVAIYRP